MLTISVKRTKVSLTMYNTIYYNEQHVNDTSYLLTVFISSKISDRSESDKGSRGSILCEI